MSEIFYQSVVASAVFCTVCRNLSKMIMEASSVLGCSLNGFEVVVVKCTLYKITAILNNKQHPSMTCWVNSEALFVENPFSSAVETSSTELVCTSSDDTTQQLITVQGHYHALSQSMPKDKLMVNGCHLNFSHFFPFLIFTPYVYPRLHFYQCLHCITTQIFFVISSTCQKFGHTYLFLGLNFTIVYTVEQ